MTHTHTHTRYHCVVDGGWSSWEPGPCSKTCGGGAQMLTRRCDNPEPSCGGNNCSGLTIQQSECNSQCCPSKIIYVYLCI